MDLDPRPGKMQPLVLLVRLDQKNLLWGPDLVFDLRTAGLCSTAAHPGRGMRGAGLPSVTRDLMLGTI